MNEKDGRLLSSWTWLDSAQRIWRSVNMYVPCLAIHYYDIIVGYCSTIKRRSMDDIDTFWRYWKANI